MAARVVCVSHATGAGGREVARVVAEGLGFVFLDEEIVARAAAREGLDPAVVADAEQRKSFLRRLLEDWGGPSMGLDQGGVGALLLTPEGGVDPSGAPAERYRTLIKDVIHETAERGDAVICSHAASFALAGRDDVLRVFVTASPWTRARRVAEERGLEREEAEKIVRFDDGARADYLKRFYEVDAELPTHYDVVVSTDALDAAQAAGVVLAAAGLR